MTLKIDRIIVQNLNPRRFPDPSFSPSCAARCRGARGRPARRRRGAADRRRQALPRRPPGPSRARAAEAPAPGADDPAVFLPSLVGPVGLYHMSTAEVGPAHHLRFGLHGEYFKADSFLLSDDTDSMLAGQLTFGFTPNQYFEIFGGILTTSNRNMRDPNEMGRTDPEVIRTHGDLLIGPKVVLPVATGFAIGLEGGLRFLASASSLSFSPSSTSAWIGPLATIDLRPLARAPLRFHVNANYYATTRRTCTTSDGTTLSSRLASKYAYGIDASRLRFAAGIDAPLEKWTGPVPLRPFAEYHAEIITANADPALVNVSGAGGSRDRQWLTFGLRAQRLPRRDARRRRRRAAAERGHGVRAAAAAVQRHLRSVISAGRRCVPQAGDRHPGGREAGAGAAAQRGAHRGRRQGQGGQADRARDRRGRRPRARHGGHRRRRHVRDRAGWCPGPRTSRCRRPTSRARRRPPT